MKDLQAKPPSKTALEKLAREQRKQAKQHKKETDAMRLEAARIAASSLTKSMPSDFTEWGVVRTRAYIQLVEIITSKAENKTMNPDRLESYLEELKRASQWSLDYCQHLSLLHARAANIGEAA